MPTADMERQRSRLLTITEDPQASARRLKLAHAALARLDEIGRDALAQLRTGATRVSDRAPANQVREQRR